MHFTAEMASDQTASVSGSYGHVPTGIRISDNSICKLTNQTANLLTAGN